MKLFLGILLLVMSIFLVVAVLMQNGKSKRLSGSIAGGAETFFGKSKSRTIDAVLSKVTTVVAILFVLAVIIVYVAFGSETAIDPNAVTITPEQLQQMIDSGEIQISDGTAESETEETPVEENAETPVEENAETPVEENAETPVEENAETPVEENAETPAEE